MQTRRDQLQAYKFQNRRALAALVTGEPNVVEPPMRRLTATTISGIMIAVLVTVGFALYGFIRPETGDAWKSAGAVITEEDTGARYVYDAKTNVLYPVLNYTSAVLALVGSQQTPHTETVDRDDLKNIPRAAPIGIPGLPDSVPKKSDLVGGPVTVCSQQKLAANQNDLAISVSVAFGSTEGARPLAADTAVLVDTGTGSHRYVLAKGHRFSVDNTKVLSYLGLDKSEVLQVGTAFLNGVPDGGSLGGQSVPDQGADVTAYNLPDRHPLKVGQLLGAAGRYSVALADGVAPVSDVDAAVLQSLPVGPGGTSIAPVAETDATVTNLRQSTVWDTVRTAKFSQLPDSLPTPDASAADAGAVCVSYADSQRQPTIGVPKSELPTFQPGTITDDTATNGGKADRIMITAGDGALVQGDGSKSVLLVDSSQQMYGTASAQVRSALGYDGVTPLVVAPQVLRLIRSGPAMDPSKIQLPTS